MSKVFKFYKVSNIDQMDRGQQKSCSLKKTKQDVKIILFFSCNALKMKNKSQIDIL